MEKKTPKKMLIESKIQNEETEPSQGETSSSYDTKSTHIGEDEIHDRDPTIINDQQSCDGNDNGETSFRYDDTQLCHIGEDEKDFTTFNIDANDNENLQEENYAYYNDLSIGECLLGREVIDLNDALNLYKAHARALGFSVRKGTSRKRGSNSVIFEKYFVCSKAGLRGKGKKELQTKSDVGISTTEGSASNSSQRKRKLRVVNETRTDCKASIRFKMTKEGRFIVVDHNIIHNHDFVKQDECHCLRSKLSTSKCVGKVIETLVASGSKQMDCCRYLCFEDKAKELDNYTKRDYLNIFSRFKMKNSKGGDMQNVLDILQQRTTDDSSFFYRVKVNDENQIVSIFWRDSMMLEDYIVYGDVLIFDTTYRINRYDLMCAPFFGINNHWKTTMFACAFIFDAKTETFEWLLETFKNSMSGPLPKSIYTDQNLEVTNAIAKVFPNTRHRLCIWHLQAFISNFDTVRSNPTFKDIFNKCLTGCDNEEEFLRSWTEMISTYGLEESVWFSQLYQLRDKWCTTLSKDFFSAHILSSQKVEVISKAVSFGANQMTSLFEFYHIFENTVKHWRKIEENDILKCTTERHPASESRCKLLKHAAEVYTLDVFDDFQKEFDMAMGSYIRTIANQGCSKMYEVSLNEYFTQSHNVQYGEELLELSCTCMSYQECGLLCYHIMRVMHMHCIFEIPNKYIMRRWTKLAKSETWTKQKGDVDDASAAEDEKELQTPWRHTMARSFYNLLTTCQYNEHAMKVCEQGLNDMQNALKPRFSNK